VLPEIPCHITQRGVDRREVFSTDQDRNTYLRLLQDNVSDAAVHILGYCLMSNHGHLVAVPAREDSLSILLRRVHGRYAQYYNARTGRSGHLWQNRFFGCMLGTTHLWAAFSYVERNPVRAGIVQHAAEYPWVERNGSPGGCGPERDTRHGMVETGTIRRTGVSCWTAKKCMQRKDRACAPAPMRGGRSASRAS